MMGLTTSLIAFAAAVVGMAVAFARFVEGLREALVRPLSLLHGLPDARFMYALPLLLSFLSATTAVGVLALVALGAGPLTFPTPALVLVLIVLVVIIPALVAFTTTLLRGAADLLEQRRPPR